MSRVELKADGIAAAPAIKSRPAFSFAHIVPVLATLAAVGAAALLGWQAWQYYMGSPWTRDGTVRAYVVKIAPQVAGEIVKLPIVDNQFVHKGDLLMQIDPRNYSIAVRQAEAAVQQTHAAAVNANAEMARRLKLSDVAVTMEERQTYISQAATAEANYQSALANLELARVNLARTEVRSPVNGYITNLTAQLGDYADVGALQLSIVNSDSYWVDAYFEETALSRIHEGDAATIKLMGYTPLLRGRVQGLARGVNVPNAQPDASGLASVNPIFTFVRLAQRVPVRIHIDEVPAGVKLVAGMTATVQIEPYKARPIPGPKPSSGEVSQAAPQPAPLVAVTGEPPQSAPPHAAPSQATQAMQPATPSAPRSKTADQPASQAAPPQAAAQPPQSESVAQSAPPNSGSDELEVSIQPSLQALAAAHEASADLRTLEEQIKANPPSGPASAPAAANRRSATSADSMPPSEYLGETVDLYDGHTVVPTQGLRPPETLRRRARPRWRHGYGHQ
jgi:RND family efflux transporter MFP subunit